MQCVVSCPARVFESVGNTGRQDALDVLALVSATLGLVIASLVFATWLLRKNLRQFPSRFTMFFAGALFLFSLAFLLPVPKCLNEAMPTAKNIVKRDGNCRKFLRSNPVPKKPSSFTTQTRQMR
ncbi:MAG: hypothetical protein MHM6MM_009506 [Cercozoa sp. M6MM]